MQTNGRRGLAIAALLVAAGLGLLGWQMGGMSEATASEVEIMAEGSASTETAAQEAVFAGGCFWCIEAAFQLMPGVLDAISGYTGGEVENPT